LHLRSSPKRENLSCGWLDNSNRNGCEYWYKSSGRSRSTLSASALRFGIETGPRVEGFPPCHTAARSKTGDQLHDQSRRANLLECREEWLGCGTFGVRRVGWRQFDSHIARQFLGNAISSRRNSRGARPLPSQSFEERRDLPLDLSAIARTICA